MLSPEEKHNYLVRTQDNFVRFPGRPCPDNISGVTEAQLVHDLHKVVLSVPWACYVNDHHRLSGIPNMSRVNLRDLDSDTCSELDFGTGDLAVLHELVVILVFFTVLRSELSPLKPLRGNWTTTDNELAGLLLLVDNLRVSIDFGRPKLKQVLLFENCLVFARWRGSERVVVHKVQRRDLLQVCIQILDLESESVVLEVYWYDKSSGSRDLSIAHLFSDDLNVLQIWAGFLSTRISDEPPARPRKMIRTRQSP